MWQNLAGLNKALTINPAEPLWAKHSSPIPINGFYTEVQSFLKYLPKKALPKLFFNMELCGIALIFVLIRITGIDKILFITGGWPKTFFCIQYIRFKSRVYCLDIWSPHTLFLRHLSSPYRSHAAFLSMNASSLIFNYD